MFTVECFAYIAYDCEVDIGCFCLDGFVLRLTMNVNNIGKMGYKMEFSIRTGMDRECGGDIVMSI